MSLSLSLTVTLTHTHTHAVLPFSFTSSLWPTCNDAYHHTHTHALLPFSFTSSLWCLPYENDTFSESFSSTGKSNTHTRTHTHLHTYWNIWDTNASPCSCFNYLNAQWINVTVIYNLHTTQYDCSCLYQTQSTRPTTPHTHSLSPAFTGHFVSYILVPVLP